VANRPSDSLSLMRPKGVGWDWRHRFYELKKHYLLELVRLGYGVLQADTDHKLNVRASPPLPPFSYPSVSTSSLLLIGGRWTQSVNSGHFRAWGC